MSHIQEISTQCQTLSEDLQKQVLDFIYFLEARYTQKQSTEDVNALTDAELEQACGILKASHGVSLEQIDHKKRNPVILGLMAEEFAIPDDFDKPLPEKLINEFYTDDL
ncbi:DUF2281 domain-containing protein [Methylomonas paludis]|uniref:DUF2281 domain-containing protein n=1 Tax=Methylomonas paludis TaxID=1173101 RepID=A0A975RA49_9GAMM|nr:DUF2281 domain-containing protein [Methylomonas paludis]QWF72095.1 DUF2281 domain-containing protein [Methylomonas paludis]